MYLRVRTGCGLAGVIALLGLGSACQHSTISAGPTESGGSGAGGSGQASGGSAGLGGAGAGGATRADAALAGTAGGPHRFDGSAGMPWFNGGRPGGSDAAGWTTGGAGSAGNRAGGAGSSAGGRTGFWGFDAHPPFGFADASSSTGGASGVDADVDGPKWSSCSSFPKCGPYEVPVRMQNPALGSQACACVVNPCGATMPTCSCAGSICGPSATCAYMPDSGFLVCTEHG